MMLQIRYLISSSIYATHKGHQRRNPMTKSFHQDYQYNAAFYRKPTPINELRSSLVHIYYVGLNVSL
ncbi:hypothetical protein LguiB_013071 [Lonicera macranthoides]